MIRRTAALVAVASSMSLFAAACSSGTPQDASETSGTGGAITVAAASALTDVFETIGEAFTASTGIDVTFSFAGSSAIAAQVRGGAPIDVFASAGASSMEPMVADGLVTGVMDFATNSLIIAVPQGNPGAVTGLSDLARVSVIVCQDQVPCGVAAAALFERNALAIAPVSYEPDVRSVLTKIETDEADAGIVYVTDVAARPDTVEGIPIPADMNVTTRLQAAVVAESRESASAAAFVAFLTGPQAQAALAAAGFAPAS